MRTISRLGRVLSLAVLLPAALAAQQGTAPIENSWFWGVGGGRISVPTAIHRFDVPMYSADWLITRHRWALQVYASQANFTDSTTVADPNPSGARTVLISDLRRVGFQGIAFFPSTPVFHPYAGLGYSFNFLRRATPLGADYASLAAQDSVQQRVNDARTKVKATFSAGVMLAFGKFAPYAQYTVMPTKGSGSWLVNGDGTTWFWEAGLRYNFGSSIEKMR